MSGDLTAVHWLDDILGFIDLTLEKCYSTFKIWWLDQCNVFNGFSRSFRFFYLMSIEKNQSISQNCIDSQSCVKGLLIRSVIITTWWSCAPSKRSRYLDIILILLSSPHHPAITKLELELADIKAAQLKPIEGPDHVRLVLHDKLPQRQQQHLN